MEGRLGQIGTDRTSTSKVSRVDFGGCGPAIWTSEGLRMWRPVPVRCVGWPGLL